jgi:N-glycosidase YbiA
MISGFKGKYSFLSNFYPCEVSFDGAVYPSVEHAFQAAKVSDPNQRTAIRHAETPRQARTLGKHVSLRKDWEQVKIGIMEDLLLKKFEDPRLKLRLLGTGDQYLQETNWWGDTFWGVCNGKGFNHLGKLLMKLRSRWRRNQ